MQPPDEIREMSLLALLFAAGETFREELIGRVGSFGYDDIRAGHGCVFGNIDPQGSRLTELAERAMITKQAVGEAVTDLERLGYVRREPDPEDRRAKIIRLTEKGEAAQQLGRDVIDSIERGWGERFGAEAVAAMREVLTGVVAGRTAQAPTA
jgi:DNA-binding MarR family transcriptional regulator